MQGVSSRVPAFFSVPSESFGYFFKSVRDWMFFFKRKKNKQIRITCLYTVGRECLYRHGGVYQFDRIYTHRVTFPGSSISIKSRNDDIIPRFFFLFIYLPFSLSVIIQHSNLFWRSAGKGGGDLIFDDDRSISKSPVANSSR